MASRAVALGAALVAGVAGLCAYTNHADFVAHGEDLRNVKFDYAQMRRMAHSVASDMMEEQRKCLQADPSKWCNRDLTYKDHYRSVYSRLVTKHKFEYAEGTTNRQNRNQWLSIFAIAFLVFAIQIRGLLKSEQDQGDDTAA